MFTLQITEWERISVPKFYASSVFNAEVVSLEALNPTCYLSFRIFELQQPYQCGMITYGNVLCILALRIAHVVPFRLLQDETIIAYNFLCAVDHLGKYTTNAISASITVYNEFFSWDGTRQDFCGTHRSFSVWNAFSCGVSHTWATLIFPYVNDIPGYLLNCKIHLYADDV